MPIHSKHPDYDAWFPRWKKCRHAAEGEEAIKAEGVAYLPKLSGHHDPTHGHQAYEAYKNRALWFGATDRTLSGYVGAIMRRDPTFTVPDALSDRMENITDAGQDATEFTHAQLKELLTTGRYGLLADKSAEDVGEMECAFLKMYYPENIWNWLVDQDNCLQAVVLEETVFLADKDPYDIKETSQLRELVMLDGVYTVRIWKQKQGDIKDLENPFELSEVIVPTLRGVPFDSIPFVFVSADKDATSCSKPPMLDLVNANINHYQLDADYRHGLHFTALPTPVFTGVDSERDYFLGSEIAINLRNENSKAFFLEFQGLGLSAIKDAMEERKSQMASLGAALIQQGASGKGVETAEAARIQHSGETSLLSMIVGRVEEAYESGLELIAKWENIVIVEDDIEVVLNRDFIDSTLTAAEITAMVGAWQVGALPAEQLYWNFQRGGIVSPETSFEDFNAAVDAFTAKKTADALALAVATPAPTPGTNPDGSQQGSGASGPKGGGGSGPMAHGHGKPPTNTEKQG